MVGPKDRLLIATNAMGLMKRFIECHKYNGDTVTGLIGILLIAISKMVALWSKGQIIDCHE